MLRLINNNQMKAKLVLENGSVFEGISFGYQGEVYGEIVFNTAMTGYQEVITDPSYADQIIVFTCPHIGNTGINFEDQESTLIWAKGIICREISSFYSNWRAQDSLEKYLMNHRIMGFCEVDTRALTNIIRNDGSLWGCISTSELSPNQLLKRINAAKKGENKVVERVSTKISYKQESSSKKFHLVVYDFGIKKSIIDSLLEFDCELTIVPWNTSFEEAISAKPDGLILSNGPGDPRECQKVIITVNQFLEVGIPILGICLGHQILGLACGAQISKMKYGHHGINHPVIDLKSGKVSISTQNHNFAIVKETIPNYLLITHQSLFDGSVQGIKHLHRAAMGFQGHPEANPGPYDISYIFSNFIRMLKEKHQTNLKKQAFA